jgi:hypothetical protein
VDILEVSKKRKGKAKREDTAADCPTKRSDDDEDDGGAELAKEEVLTLPSCFYKKSRSSISHDMAFFAVIFLF